jgi:hypothetical protein
MLKKYRLHPKKGAECELNYSNTCVKLTKMGIYGHTISSKPNRIARNTAYSKESGMRNEE